MSFKPRPATEETVGSPNHDIEDVMIVENQMRGRRHRDRKNKRAVVFVHGFTGHQDTTWVNPENAAEFDSMILSDPDLKGYDAYRFTYATTFLRGSNADHLAQRLEQALNQLSATAAKEGRDYSFVLVAHSLGGLVCMRYILNQLIKNQTPPIIGLILYATPTTGTGLVTVVKGLLDVASFYLRPIRWVKSLLLRSQKQFNDLETANGFLTNLHDQWAGRCVNGGNAAVGQGRMWLPVRVVTAEQDLFVPEHSAKSVYGAIDWQSLNYGHVAVCKPKSTTDDRYIAAKGFLEAGLQSHGPEVQSEIWNLGQVIWDNRTKRIVSSLEYNSYIHATPPHSIPIDDVLSNAGLSSCLVSCKYRGLLKQGNVKVGVGFGTIGTQDVWDTSPEPELVHTMGLNLLPELERKKVLDGLNTVMNLGKEAAWDVFCPKFRVMINGVELIATEVERKDQPPYEWLRRVFALPEHLVNLVGEEVVFEMQYQSVVPLVLAYFRFNHRWLTRGSSCQVTINRDLDYLISSKRLASGQDATITPGDDRRSVKFATAATVLPGTGFEVSWWEKK